MNPATLPQPSQGRNNSLLWTFMSVTGVCLALLAMVYFLTVEAPPPKKIVIATGGKQGAYYNYALQYAKILKGQGINLEVRETKGSMENLDLLLDPNSGVDLALVQSGTVDKERCEPTLNTIASLYREPLWIFHKGVKPVTQLHQLAGKKIAVGPEGSGTRVNALDLLRISGVDGKNSEFVPASASEAAELLEQSKIDAAFFVAGPDAAYVKKLMKAPGVELVELDQREAYLRRFRFFSTVNIPMGMFDLKDNIPPAEKKLLAPVAMLVARKSFHPALVSLMLTTVSKVHDQGDLLSNPGEFPSGLYADLPIDEDAIRYLKSGPPFLQRILPFWLAIFVDRMKVMIIPLIVLFMPVIRAAPPLMRWRIRRKIYLWYAQLRVLDVKTIFGMDNEEAQRSLEQLMSIEQQVAQVEIPLSYMEEYYNLRVHLNLVRQRIETILRAD